MNPVMTRLDAIQDIMCGRGIMLTFQGRFTTYRVILRRNAADYERVEAVYEDIRHGFVRRFHVSPKQVLTYIRRWYPRKLTGEGDGDVGIIVWDQVAA